MPMYRPSSVQEIVVIARPVLTTTTIAAYGSADGFTTPGTEFGDDEEIMVSGTVAAGNSADLTGVLISVLVEGTPVGTVQLYGFDGALNYYQLNLGMMAEGTYTIEAQFPRTRR